MVGMETETVIPLTMARLKFGVGATEELGYELRILGARKVLLVTDRRLREHGLVEKVKTIIEKEKIDLAVYDEVRCEPTDASMRHAIDAASRLDFDAIVALGGGSTLDTAKAVNLYRTWPADLYEYINAPIGRGKPVPGPLKPLIALPTTSGSGSETTTVIVMDLLEMHLKTGTKYRFRFFNMTNATANLHVVLRQGGVPVQWRLVAKDAVDLAPSAAKMKRADQLVSVGETYDVEFMAQGPQTLTLEGLNPNDGRRAIQTLIFNETGKE